MWDRINRVINEKTHKNDWCVEGSIQKRRPRGAVGYQVRQCHEYYVSIVTEDKDDGNLTVVELSLLVQTK